MTLSNFDESTLAGENPAYQQAVLEIHRRYGFDFTALGLAAFHGSSLRWIYSAGATDDRHKRIALSPGHGIGGIVLKAGKPMLFTDIDRDIDPREYSSYPIVFAEDLRSFQALPVVKEDRVVGVILTAFRTLGKEHAGIFARLRTELDGGLCDLAVITSDSMDFDDVVAASSSREQNVFADRSLTAKLIGAQEEERKRIARELHDGIAQELLAVRFQLQKILTGGQEKLPENVAVAQQTLDAVIDELHNISVELRPSTLDHFGLLSALKSQAAVYRENFGVDVIFDAPHNLPRTDPAYETQAYRIIQEALLNSCKYSGTDQAWVSIRIAGEWMEAVVSDHGDGFDVEQPVVRGSGCGLSGMRERASLIGAQLKIESGSDGTTVTLLAPTGSIKGGENDSHRIG